MSANETHEEDQRSYKRHFNQWRYPVGLNCHLCVLEVIDRLLRLRRREDSGHEREREGIYGY